ncbi:uncharacterized protein [Fopius arisanus]|uniref:Baculoviridae p74 N-terminal domain-containing protein n=1 Tax=Fopius arisanus TaxID=64838 RepID=A0A9R1U610_9HYME|nr:PREDICTED: uncharacterized protein LOC105270512 [Fopius arisanus]
MATFTEKDKQDAVSYAAAFIKLKQLKLMFKKVPHLTSHLHVDIRSATDSDYRISKALETRSMVVTANITKDLCEAISCTPEKEKGICTPNDNASFYIVGNDQFDIQCQPACFNTKTSPTISPEKMGVNTPHLVWAHNKSCRYVNSSIIAMLEKPFYRGKTQYEKRVNDIGWGFNRRYDPNDFIGAGYKYEFNSNYCDIFNMSFDENTHECKYTFLQTVANTVIGPSLIGTLKSGITVLINGSEDLGIPADHYNRIIGNNTMPEKYTLEGWKKNINSDFSHKIFDKQSTLSITNMSLKDFNPTNLPRRQQEEGISEGMIKEGKIMLVHFKEVIVNYLKSMFTIEYWEQEAISQGVELAITSAKKLAKRVMTKCTPAFCQRLLQMSTKVGPTVAKTAMKSVFKRVAVQTVARVASRAAIALARVLAGAASIIGILLFIASILDIIFLIWDPYGYNKMLPPEWPRDNYRAGETQFRQDVGKTVAEYTFEDFLNLILTEDEKFDIDLESYQHQNEYLSSLERGETIFTTKLQESSIFGLGDFFLGWRDIREKSRK